MWPLVADIPDDTRDVPEEDLPEEFPDVVGADQVFAIPLNRAAAQVMTTLLVWAAHGRLTE